MVFGLMARQEGVISKGVTYRLSPPKQQGERIDFRHILLGAKMNHFMLETGEILLALDPF